MKYCKKTDEIVKKQDTTKKSYVKIIGLEKIFHMHNDMYVTKAVLVSKQFTNADKKRF